VTLKSAKDLCIYMVKQGKYILKNSETVSAITDETLSLWIATSWGVARDYA